MTADAVAEGLPSSTPAAAWLGRRFLDRDPESGAVRVAYRPRPECANRHGTVQGGFQAAMLDSAAVFSLLMELAPHQTAVSTRLDTRFLKPAPLADLVATVLVRREGDRDAVAEASLATLDGTVVSSATVSIRILTRRV